MLTRVVLSDGGDNPFHPRPASLFVVCELGHAFRALPLDEKRRMIEAGLTEALATTLDKLDVEPGEPVEGNGEAVAA